MMNVFVEQTLASPGSAKKKEKKYHLLIYIETEYLIIIEYFYVVVF